MARDALVIGDCLVVNQRALGEVGGCDHYTSRTFAVQGTNNVVRRGRRLERRDCLNSHCRLGQQSEELRQFRLYLGDIAAEVGMYLGLFLREARKEVRSAKPSSFAIAAISASMRAISCKPS